MQHRLGIGRRVGEAEHRLERIHPQRQEVVGTGQADEARQHRRLQLVLRQPARVQRHHGGVVGPGAVPHHEDTTAVDLPLAGLLPGPGHGLCAVFDELRVAHLGVQAVVGHHHDHAACRQGAPHEGVIGALTAAPGTAVEKHHHGPAAGRRLQALGRQVHIGALAVVAAIGLGAQVLAHQALASQRPVGGTVEQAREVQRHGHGQQAQHERGGQGVGVHGEGTAEVMQATTQRGARWMHPGAHRRPDMPLWQRKAFDAVPPYT